MSTTLLSLVSASSGALSNPESVELASEDGSFGVRRTDTGEVIVPSGTAVDNPQDGLWTYEFEDPTQDISYECSFKITLEDDEVVYLGFYRYVPLEAFEDSESSSDSESSESTTTEVRNITLTRTALTRESSDGRDLFRMTLETVDSNFMPVNVFAYMKGTNDPRGERDPLEYFYFVATPFDATIYPTGSPDPTQRPGFYLTNTVEVLAPSSAAAEQFEDDMRAELACLVAAYNRLDYLEPYGEVVITGAGMNEEVISEELAICNGYTFADGEQLELVEAELDLAF